MVDAEGALFREQAGDGVVNHLAGGEVFAQRLLQRHPHILARQPGLLERGEGLHIQRRRDGEEDADIFLAGIAQHVAHRTEAGGIVEIGAVIPQAGEKGGQARRILAVARQIFGHRVTGEFAEVLVAHGAARGAHQREARRQQVFRMQGEERRQQHALRQVAGSPQQDQGGGVRGGGSRIRICHGPIQAGSQAQGNLGTVKSRKWAYFGAST